MCIGFTNGHKDFPPYRASQALAAMTPGSAVSFDRIGLFHFAIFLGFGWSDSDSAAKHEPVPLLCHFSGDTATQPKVSVRLDSFYDVVQNSTIRVYKCKCSSEKRLEVIRNCLASVGSEGYNVVLNNCEHFVRRLINNENISYQSMWTFLAPMVQLPRLLIGLPIGGSISSSASCLSSKRLSKIRSLILIDPMMDLMRISIGNDGLTAAITDTMRGCTRQATGSNCSLAVKQDLYTCTTCDSYSKCGTFLCKYCATECHSACSMTGPFEIISQSSFASVCGCSHVVVRPTMAMKLKLWIKKILLDNFLICLMIYLPVIYIYERFKNLFKFARDNWFAVFVAGALSAGIYAWIF